MSLSKEELDDIEKLKNNMYPKEYTFNEYQEEAMRTKATYRTPEDQLVNAALGMAEAGEIANVVKKYVHHGHAWSEATENKLIKEAGDLLWYIAELADYLDVSMEEIARRNIKKLANRYPEGYFSTERSENREIE